MHLHGLRKWRPLNGRLRQRMVLPLQAKVRECWLGLRCRLYAGSDLTYSAADAEYSALYKLCFVLQQVDGRAQILHRVDRCRADRVAVSCDEVVGIHLQVRHSIAIPLCRVRMLMAWWLQYFRLSFLFLSSHTRFRERENE